MKSTLNLIFLLFSFLSISLFSHPVYAQSLPVSGQKEVVQNYKIDLAQYSVFGTDCSFKEQGDANCDKVINQFDLAIWETEFNSVENPGRADFNSDGTVDLLDFGLWRATFQPVTSASAQNHKSFLSTLFQSIKQVFSSIHFTAQAQEVRPAVNSVDSSAYVTSSGNGYVSTVRGQETQYVSMSGNAIPVNSQFFDKDGKLTAQVEFSPSAGTTVTALVDGVEVITNQTAGGAVIEQYQQPNGSLIALKSWPTADSYQKSEPPQAVTLPGRNNESYLTLSMQPNGTALFQETDRSGTILQTSSFTTGGLYNRFDPQTKVQMQSLDSVGMILVSMDNKLGGKTTYTLLNKVILNVTQTDDKGNVWIAKPQGGYDSWELIQITVTPEVRMTVANPIEAVGSDTPTPAELIRVWNYYADPANSNPNPIDFSTGFNSTASGLGSAIQVGNELYKQTRVTPPSDVLGLSLVKEAYAQQESSSICTNCDAAKENEQPKPGHLSVQTGLDSNRSGSQIGTTGGVFQVQEVKNQNGNTTLEVAFFPNKLETDGKVNYASHDGITISPPGTGLPTTKEDWDKYGQEKAAEIGTPTIPSSTNNSTTRSEVTEPTQTGTSGTSPANLIQPGGVVDPSSSRAQADAAAAIAQAPKDGTAEERGKSVVENIAKTAASDPSGPWDVGRTVSALRAAALDKDQNISIPTNRIEALFNEKFTQDGIKQSIGGSDVGNVIQQAYRGSKKDQDNDSKQPTVQPPPVTGGARQANGLPAGVGSGSYPSSGQTLPSSYAGVRGTTTRTDAGNGISQIVSTYPGLATHTINVRSDGVIQETWAKADGTTINTSGPAGGNTTISSITTESGASITVSADGSFATFSGWSSAIAARDAINAEIDNRNAINGPVENKFEVSSDGSRLERSTSASMGMPSCFLAGTLISTPRGQIPIEQLKPGDTVFSYSEKTGQKEISDFRELDINFVDEYLIINNTLHASVYHPFYRVRDFGLETVRADELLVGDILQTESGTHISVSSIVHVPAPKTTVYNLLSVSKNNNFFAEGILVHNYPGPENITYDTTVESFDGSSEQADVSSEQGFDTDQGSDPGADQGSSSDQTVDQSSYDGSQSGGGNEGNSSNE